jgi:hypothetical protein
MDWNIESTSVVIVGAGFSAAATEGRLPLMTGYFDRLKQEKYPELYEFVRVVGCNKTCERIEQANVERVLLAYDQIRTSPTGVLDDRLDCWRSKLADVQGQMSYYTLDRLKDSLDISEGNWAVQLLAHCGLDTTLVSMNYDNIAEVVLSNRDGMMHSCHSPTPNCPHCKMRLLLQRACSCATRESDLGDAWRGALVKPHGSIAWKRCQTPGCCSYECLVADEQCRPFEPCNCPYCFKPCGPVLVMPTMSKNLKDLPEIGTMWRAARSAMREAESLLLFGFSMPTSDELLVQLIRSAVEDGRRLKRVASIDLEPGPVLKRFESCLPAGFDVETFAFPVQRGEVPNWFDLNSSTITLRC